MATRFSMTIVGGKELAANLRTLSTTLQRTVIIDALKEAAEPMRRTMSQLAPRAPGHPDLADNIGISVANRLGDVGGGRWEARHEEEHAVAVGPTKDFFYGMFVEYGHKPNSSAKPFMRPAFDSTVNTSLTILTQQLWAAIRDQRLLSTMGRGL